MKYVSLILVWCLSLTACVSNTKIKNGNYTEHIDGLKINFKVKGNGPIMIVGHPNAGKIGYELTLKPLEDYFTMVYYDPRGTGQSESPKTLEGYRAEHLVKELDLLRQYLGVSKIWLFGHSDQSAINLQYAVEHPDKVSGIILTGTSLIGNQDDSIERRKVSEKKRISESKWFEKVIKDWDYMITHNTNVDEHGIDISNAPIKWWTYNEESFNKVLPIAKEISKSGRRKPVDNQYYRETKEDREKYLDIQKKFKTLNTKVLIVNGLYDTNNPPKYAKALHEALPNSTLVLIDKAGHFPWVEQKEITFTKIKAWLDQDK